LTAPETQKIVVTDTCVLINLIHVGRLPFLGDLPGYEFIIPDHVYEEVTEPEQRQVLDDALEQGRLRKEPLTDLPSIELYASLRGSLGSGEAACLAMAATRGWLIASDEGHLFRREVIKRLGEARLLTTVRLYVLAIEVGLLTIEEADRDKVELERRRFKTSVASFGDLVTRREESPDSEGEAR
jgi:predicted nucleic acid-binding protein